jgi:hypothetical protein
MKIDINFFQDTVILNDVDKNLDPASKQDRRRIDQQRIITHEARHKPMDKDAPRRSAALPKCNGALLASHLDASIWTAPSSSKDTATLKDQFGIDESNE